MLASILIAVGARAQDAGTPPSALDAGAPAAPDEALAPDTAAPDGAAALGDAVPDDLETAGDLGAPQASRAPSRIAPAAPAPPSPSVTVADADATDSVAIHVPTGLGHDFVATLGGYVETAFTWSFAEPWNGLIAWRGFDNRHATFTLANVALVTRFELDRVYTAITLQWGNTPDTYYLAEPSGTLIGGSPEPSGRFGVGPSSAATWRFLQEAYFGWNAPVLDGLAIEGGLFLSPIGFESLAIRDGWHWSRSNLFYGLPFYHTGIRLRTPLSSEWTLSAGVFNGWNSVLDNNDEKSGAVWIDYATDELAFHALYFGGVERVDGNWRSLFDAWVRWTPIPWLSLALHGNAGFEPVSGAPEDDSMNWWAAGALYVRVLPIEWLAIAARADVFADHAPGDIPSQRLFWPTTPLMASQTVTVQVMPEPHLSFFVEYRHDHAEPDPSRRFAGSFFDGRMTSSLGGIEPTSSTQDTITFGATAGF